MFSFDIPIGTDNYEDFTTEKLLLGASNAVSRHKDLFRAGGVDTFKVSTSVNIGVPKKVRVGFAAKNSTLGSGWMLNRVELRNGADAAYEFVYDDWLDDKTSETVLYESDEMGPSRQRAARPRSSAVARDQGASGQEVSGGNVESFNSIYQLLMTVSIVNLK